ncbi:MAG: rhamnulokinase [Eubacteriales bacterium]|nr:rhamnulokinase [Eubacteriales bacterium]
MPIHVLAIDIGASSGRHILGSVKDGKLTLEEIYRFPNGLVQRNGHHCWDVDALWADVVEGLKKCAMLGKIPVSVGIDTWGVDYVLLDRHNQRIGDCFSYRDNRTEPLLDRLSAKWLFKHTGIAKQPFNTVYQLMATPSDWLSRADRCLLIPDYFHFLLSGVKSNEYTNASTGALLNCHTRDWDKDVLAEAGIPARLFPDPPVAPGTLLGPMKADLAKEVGFSCEVIAPATHDTGSAFMAVPSRDENTVTLSSGTWSLLGVENDEPVLSEQARKAGFTNEGGYDGTFRFLHNITGLWLLQSIRRELGDRHTYSELTELAQKGETYPGLVDLLDNRFLAPAGGIVNEITAALQEAGSQPPASLAELLGCVMHSLAHGYAEGIRSLETLTGRQYNALHIVGGGSRNEVLNQWTANAAGLPVYAGPDEGSALGNVIAQLIALGEIADLQQARAMVHSNFPIKTYLPN